MPSTRLLIIAAVVVVFLAAGGYVAFRNAGGGGQTRDVTLTVANNRMTPDTIQARQGDTLRITVLETDTDQEVHLHGYDVHFEGPAGQPIERTIRADKTGRFELELEQTSTHLGELDVT